MAVCRFCLCRIDPTKVQVATYVQGTSRHATADAALVARDSTIIQLQSAPLAEDTQRHPQCPSVTIYNARCAS